jgi:ABC-type bacteriocin/lantibiotic exporter with double-glycine peptidase domain
VTYSSGSRPARADAATFDSGLAGLVLVARFHGIAADPAQLAHEFQVSGHPFNRNLVMLAAKNYGTPYDGEAGNKDRSSNNS